MSKQPSPPDLAQVQHDVARALAEDLGSGDVTASLIAADRIASATIVCREAAVIAGAAWVDETFRAVDALVDVTWNVADGAQVEPDACVCAIRGPARALVSAERTALNFLQTLSATATATARYVSALGSSNTQILDTRKTIPGLRHAQKYAVLCGGGNNHRIGLFDAILIKENHIAAAGGITPAIERLRSEHPQLRIEVEVESLDDLSEALSAGCDMVLLDNFSKEQTRAAVAMVDGRVKIELSGGVELESLNELGTLGADYISVGALTKHIRAIDFSMRITA